MNPTIPVIIDTNILVPSLYRSTHILQFILSGNLVLIWNNFIYDEAYRIVHEMWDDYYSKKNFYDLSEVVELLDIVFNLGIKVVDMPIDWPPASRDRKDDPFLWASEVGWAYYIISNDKRHMLLLKMFNGTPIGRPIDFFEWAKKEYPMDASNLSSSLYFY